MNLLQTHLVERFSHIHYPQRQLFYILRLDLNPFCNELWYCPPSFHKIESVLKKNKVEINRTSERSRFPSMMMGGLQQPAAHNENVATGK